jgi:hypothetical protein
VGETQGPEQDVSQDRLTGELVPGLTSYLSIKKSIGGSGGERAGGCCLSEVTIPAWRCFTSGYASKRI